MSITLNKIFDPRDNLEKARRKELENFAKANGISDVRPGMPAPLMRKILRQMGLTGIPVPRHRFLGGPPDMAVQNRPDQNRIEPQNAKGEEIDATALLEREWSKPDFNSMSIIELRRECKSRGIKLARTDKMTDMVRKLNGQNPS